MRDETSTFGKIVYFIIGVASLLVMIEIIMHVLQ